MFSISLSTIYFVFLYMKILERSSFISQQNLSYILQQRIRLLFDILFVAMHYLTAVGMCTKNQNVYSHGQNTSGIILLFFFFAKLHFEYSTHVFSKHLKKSGWVANFQNSIGSSSRASKIWLYTQNSCK